MSAAIAQMISTKSRHHSSVTVIMLAGSRPSFNIVPRQDVIPFPAWCRIGMFSNPGFRGLVIIFLIASLSEIKTARRSTFRRLSRNHRRPSDRNSGFKYALFFLAEYLAMRRQRARRHFSSRRLHAPWAFLDDVPRISGFSSKLMGLVFFCSSDSRDVAAFARGPLLNLALEIHAADGAPQISSVAPSGNFTSVWNVAGAIFWRWLLCAAMIAIPYVWLGRALTAGENQRAQVPLRD